MNESQVVKDIESTPEVVGGLYELFKTKHHEKFYVSVVLATMGRKNLELPYGKRPLLRIFPTATKAKNYSSAVADRFNSIFIPKQEANTNDE